MDTSSAPQDDSEALTPFRQEADEAIARLNADPAALAAYQAEAHEWAEADVEVRDEPWSSC